MSLKNVALPVQIRLRSIEVLLESYGFVQRETLANLHGLEVATIARDLALYKELNEEAVFYNRSTRRIEKLSTFKSIF